MFEFLRTRLISSIYFLGTMLFSMAADRFLTGTDLALAMRFGAGALVLLVLAFMLEAMDESSKEDDKKFRRDKAKHKKKKKPKRKKKKKG